MRVLSQRRNWPQIAPIDVPHVWVCVSEDEKKILEDFAQIVAID